jgi:hypothetical protein
VVRGSQMRRKPSFVERAEQTGPADVAAPTPERGSLAILGTGLAAFLWQRRPR